MGVGIFMFSILSTTFSPYVVRLKSPLGPPNMANQDSIKWYYINIILNNTLGALDQLLINLEGTGNIPKELSEFIGRDATKPNAYGNETQTMTKVEATADLKQRFDNITCCLDDEKKEGGYILWFLIVIKFDRYNSYTIGIVKKQRAWRLSSYLGLLDNKLQEILEIA